MTARVSIKLKPFFMHLFYWFKVFNVNKKTSI